jgi:ABC-2 type transport system permease protein
MKLYRAYILATVLPLLRTPSYWVPLVIFPTLLYSFFGLPASQDNPQTANILMASWSVFAVIGISFFQFGVSIAQAREARWEDYARTLPAGGFPRIVAQIVAAALFLAIALVLLWSIAAATSAVDLSIAQYVKLLGVLLIGIVPFVLMGAALGYSVPARGAVPIANLLYLPLSYLGGLWMPPEMLPDLVEKISPFTPTRQLGELAWSSVLGTMPPVSSVIGLVFFSIIGAAVTLVMWRRDETKRTS